jgi:LuxR family maltose regulon positive regulatory protein
VLEERTEGWIAGLQMAALSMRDREDKRSFIDRFSGTHRYILDYLLEEVLANQSPEVQHFLLSTSILERLTAPLCDAILRERAGDSTHALTPSSAILDDLERANLFLVPLDDERRWYRYHHLFADLLRARLDQACPGLALQLHARAAAWLEKEQMTVEAINHALAAGANDQAARLVEENTTHLLATGELTALMSWIEALPAELQLSRPWLCIHQAYALTMAGRLAGVPELLARAEAPIETENPPNLAAPNDRSDEKETSSALMGETQALMGAVATIRAMVAVMTGQDGEAISQAQRARQLLPGENLWDRAAAAWALGYAQRSLGHLPEAHAAFEEQIRLGRAMGNIWTLVTGLNDQAMVLWTQGQLRQARTLFEEALVEASHREARSLGYIARMEAGLASVLYEQNELEDASRLLEDAIVHTRLWPNPNHRAYAYALQCRLFLAQGDLQGARASIAEADSIRRSAPLTRPNRRLVETNLIRVWLALQAAGGSLDLNDPFIDQAKALVQAWQGVLTKPVENTAVRMDDGTQMTALSLARVFLAAGQVEEALSLLERAVQSARAVGHQGELISSLLLNAIARKHKAADPVGQIPPALTSLALLEEALSLAEPGGYVRIFLDEGKPVQMLLAQWLAQARTGPLRAYAIRLLSYYDGEPDATVLVQERKPQAGSLVEPLSRRELEVLHLLALGRTNQEIASQLVVAIGTVKAQTASIYRKLDATNRTEAVARARQLGILP